MHFNQFKKSMISEVAQSEIAEHTVYYNHSLAQTTDGRVLLNNRETCFCNIHEAKQYIKSNREISCVSDRLVNESYKSISNSTIVEIIQKHNHGVRVTNSMIEQYINLAKSKKLTTDKVVQEIRALNSDYLIAGRLDYKLDDNSTIIIERETQELINNLSEERVRYMSFSKENFMQILAQIKE